MNISTSESVSMLQQAWVKCCIQEALLIPLKMSSGWVLGIQRPTYHTQADPGQHDCRRENTSTDMRHLDYNEKKSRLLYWLAPVINADAEIARATTAADEITSDIDRGVDIWDGRAVRVSDRWWEDRLTSQRRQIALILTFWHKLPAVTHRWIQEEYEP